MFSCLQLSYYLSSFKFLSSFDDGNDEDLLSQHLDGVFAEDQAEHSEESDEGSI